MFGCVLINKENYPVMKIVKVNSDANQGYIKLLYETSDNIMFMIEKCAFMSFYPNVSIPNPIPVPYYFLRQLSVDLIFVRQY